MKKRLFFLSILFNILFLIFSGYYIYKKGGLNFIKRNLNMSVSLTEENYSNYYKTKTSIFRAMSDSGNAVIFFGDSMTDYCDWNELLKQSNIINRGVSGDVISGAKNRLSEVTASKPKQIFLMIGINDLVHNRTVTEILSDYGELLNQIMTDLPESELFIQSMLPTLNVKSVENTDIIEINKGLVEISKKLNITYVNLYDVFKDENNNLKSDFTIDGIHLNGEGYLQWKSEIEHLVED